jgi:hypothetical protein
MAMNKNQNESVQQAADRPKTLRIVLSIVIAFFVWMAAMLAAPEITKAIRDVPITVDIPTSAMLEVVDGADTKVSLVLDGKQFEIGSYGPENVRVVADASAITEPGTYEVPLVVSDNGTRSYTVTSISPATVTLTFETRATKLLQIQADITGLTTPANYIAPEDEIMLEPSTVEVSGAESLISRVERAVIEVDFSREVSSTQQQNSKIVYYDAEGNKLETEEVTYFHQDVSSVAVTVPVKRVATLPLTVSFLNVPENFPVHLVPQILGASCQMWGEWIPTVESMNYHIYPRIGAYAEVFWTLPIQKDYVRFRKSLEYFLTRWKKQGIIYGPTRNNQIHSTQQTNIEFGIPDEYNDPYRYITGTSDKALSIGN